MSLYYFIVPNYHRELFGHETPVRDTEIKEAIFGYDATELWARESKETRKDASRYIQQVNVDKLDGVAYREIEEGLWAGLTKSVSEIGITTPLLVMEQIGDKSITYYILEGHHRSAVAIKLGMQAVPALVIRCDAEYTSKMLG